MRRDMDKVLVERPRRFWSAKRQGRTLPHELLPKRLGMSRGAQEAQGEKDLNENLAPLRRYLERQIGRSWNKVYGEMRAHIDPSNTVQAHILTHVDNFLNVVVVRVAPSGRAPCGLRYQASTWSGPFRPVRERALYVDPDDGLIKRARRRIPARPPRPVRAPRKQHIGKDRLAIELEGFWYAVRLSTFRVVKPAGTAKASMFEVGGRLAAEWSDPIAGPVWAHDRAKLDDLAKLYGPGLLASGKRQLSHRDMARYGLAG
jgi:hypothetical protein